MQVKKFEAKSMKDALEMVKTHLGPEAIILSARDTHRGFGLMGEKSVEVTAAVSEETLRRKKIAEAKLREELRQRFQSIPASAQKKFINKVFQEAVPAAREAVTAGGGPEPVTAELRAQTRGLRYIDISDEEQPRPQVTPQSRYQAATTRPPAPSPRPAPVAAPAALAAQAASFASVFDETSAPPARSARVSAAAAAAASAARATFSAPPAQASVAAAVSSQADVAHASAQRSVEVQALESQVRELKAIVERFQNVPQIPMSMHPGAEQGLPFELSHSYQRLTTQGVQPQLTTSILRRAQREMDVDSVRKPALVDAWCARHLMDMVRITAQPWQSRYHIFAGTTAQGKTTTLVKFASQLMLKEKRTIAILSLDTFKLGAADQLRLYAQILNVPFAIVRNPEEWAVAERKLAHVQHILVDLPGLSLRTPEEVEWLKRFLPPPSFSKSIHFVQSVLARDEEAAAIASRYQGLCGFDDVIFTRLDESSRHGAIVNFQDRFQAPLHSFAFGTRIPEDFEFATKERVIDLIFKLSKVNRREDTV